ncbi:hypothetical protein CAL12_12755 [Bordetella genomosp. 8]|uniref:Leucine-rich repeat domain-containing protein n=1 Tax=Bordetella genomosp. 8 TaxID=1416806 RepID=A0A1W6YKU4_9BORD|nr:hypothetical protein [Bordetella genomosp. 8]ARP81589.1 hypothetical protein CAL12_12755 [Bordetella genomosp. 8]
MIVISPIHTGKAPPVDTQRQETHVNITHSALARATADMDSVPKAGDTVLLASGVKVDPRVAKALDLYVADARPGEDRITARQRIEAAIAQGHNAKLSLKGLGLLEPPPIIPAVFSLDLSDNQLSKLPMLPCDIQFLLLARNAIKEFTHPLPSQLVVLDISHNGLTQLPDNLPERLARLDAQNNALWELPARLPRDLRILNVADNPGKLKKAARQRLATESARRVYDVAMGGPGVSAARARKNLDNTRCEANFDARMARIAPLRA